MNKKIHKRIHIDANVQSKGVSSNLLLAKISTNQYLNVTSNYFNTNPIF